MAVMHRNTTFDPQERAIAIVTELEREALDEDMMHHAMQQMVEIFASRQAVCIERVREEQRSRTLERRRDRDNANVKGITPAPLKSNVIQVPGVIPSRH